MQRKRIGTALLMVVVLGVLAGPVLAAEASVDAYGAGLGRTWHAFAEVSLG